MSIILPKVGQHVILNKGLDGATVTSVSKPLASGRFKGMHVVCVDWDKGRSGSFMAELSAFTIDDDNNISDEESKRRGGAW